MDDSESQFNALLANLVVRANKILEQRGDMLPLGLLLKQQEEVDVFLSDANNEWSLAEAVQHLQNSMIDAVRRQPAVAACIAYPDYENEVVVAYLENDEHFCSKCLIPVSTSPSLRVDVERIEVEDGAIFIFGEGQP